jgi:hypothetical protein
VKPEIGKSVQKSAPDEALGGGRERAGSLRQEGVIAALDHARIAEGRGGPAEMVSGQHHVRMNMYIAQAKNGRFDGRHTVAQHRR